MRVRGSRELTDADALRYAYRLLSYRDRSEKELEERLSKKGFSGEAVRAAIAGLKEKGFINDAALAASLKRAAEEIKLLGPRGVRAFLQQRGLSRSTIESVLADNETDEIERAKKLVERKFKTAVNYPDETARKKMWNFLGRKGYSFDAIRKTLKLYGIKEEGK